MNSSRRTLVVTGGIGSGKSEVSRYLGSLGYPEYDCDGRAKELYTPDVLEEVEEKLELKDLGAGDKVDFGKIAEAVFRDEEKLRTLESIIHPLVLRDFLRWRDTFPEGTLSVMESAIFPLKPLFHTLASWTVEVVAPLSLRIERVRKRSCLSEAQVLERIDSQKFPDNFSADYIIVNDGSLEDLHKKTEEIIKQIENENRFS